MAVPLIYPNCPAHMDQQQEIMLRPWGFSTTLCHANACYKHNSENAPQFKTADSGIVIETKCKDVLFNFWKTPMLCLKEKAIKYLGWDVLCHNLQQPDQICLEARGAILSPQNLPTRTFLLFPAKLNTSCGWRQAREKEATEHERTALVKAKGAKLHPKISTDFCWKMLRFIRL